MQRFDIPEYDSPPDSLTAQLETAVQRARMGMVAVQVPERGTYWCELHWVRHQAERVEADNLRRAKAAADPLYRPLHELDHTTAVLELGDSLECFHVSDGAGNRIELPMCQLKLAQVWKRTGVVAW